MTHEEMVELLRSRFTDRFHAPRDEGWNEMVNFLADQTGVSFEQAEEHIDELQEKGILNFVTMDEPDAPAMLEAARYGEMPDQGTAEGYWTIGSE